MRTVLCTLISLLLCFPTSMFADSSKAHKGNIPSKKRVPGHTKATTKKVIRDTGGNGNNMQTDLGLLYGFGKGSLIDEQEILRCLLLAAENGHVGAQHSLGLIYSSGTGVSRDDREAAKWFLRAAKQGHRDAQDSLGLMYYIGIGLPSDKKEAVKWFFEAAKQGHSDAQFNLGLMYMMGDGVPQDIVQAHMWFALSSTPSSFQSKKQKEKLEKRMTPDEIAKAEQLTEEWLANYPVNTF